MTKSFGDVTALAGVGLQVPAGSITALLGPNGAGKTTLVRILATLEHADAGRVEVLGFDVARQPGAVRARIGLTGQYTGLDEGLTGRDNLVLIGRLAGLGRRAAQARAVELGERFGLVQALDRLVHTYSGGTRRRLDLAAGLVADPRLLVLDEPTTGLDPTSRHQLWQVLAELRAGGTSLLLTTQYLEDADRLADLIHVLDHGTVVASGSPAALKARVGDQMVEITLIAQRSTIQVARHLADRLRIGPTQVHTGADSGRITLVAHDGLDSLLRAAATLRDAGIEVADIGLRHPSLDETFLALIGTPTTAKPAR
ncbi:MAG TPA: ATP-binding cassette domain-containing protein [Actinomycetes bacterium]|nr:ATP-binding cassette domain-containing protein [Actinomycetes bacterium]